MTPFERRLDEVQRWLACELAEPSMRSALLRPSATNEQLLYETAMTDRDRWDVVEELAARRSRLIISLPIPSPSRPGRLLLSTAMNVSIPDGVSQAESDGFFDEEDLPPWDTWIGYGQDPSDGDWKLVAWVPEPFIAAADRGITVNAYDCLAWASAPTADWCVHA